MGHHSTADACVPCCFAFAAMSLLPVLARGTLMHVHSTHIFRHRAHGLPASMGAHAQHGPTDQRRMTRATGGGEAWTVVSLHSGNQSPKGACILDFRMAARLCRADASARRRYSASTTAGGSTVVS